MITPVCSSGPFRSCNYSKHNIFISSLSDVWAAAFNQSTCILAISAIMFTAQKANIFSHCCVDMESESLLSLLCFNLVIWVYHTLWLSVFNHYILSLVAQCNKWLLVIKMNMFLKGLSQKTLSVSCVDKSLICLTDRSIIMSAVRTHLPLCVCTEPRGNRCAVHRPESTWCSAAAHHAAAPHTITHSANRCHVQRRTTKYNIWDLNRAWMPQSSERPHTANTSRMQQCCHVCRTQV